MEKKEIVEILNEIGLLLELKGENPFKSRAYYNAARTIELLDEDIETLVKEGKLKEVKGIGEALNKKITELVLTGRLKYYEDLKASVPEGLLDMLKIPGLGPKRVRTIYEQLNITSVRELEYACLENRLLDLPGFGEKMQNKILKGIQFIKQFSSHFLYSEAYLEAVNFKEYLDSANVALMTEIAGSLRRKKEIVKDIDILSASNNPNNIIQTFLSYPKIKEITEKGDTKSSVILENGIGVDLRVVKEDQFPYAFHHFTGSKEHNTAMRYRAKNMGIKMNEYGLFRGEELIRCDNEEEIFSYLGLSFIPPELRENMGEIEAAEKGNIPNLVDESDLKGILHVHTRYSDGSNSLEELVKATKNLGYSYIGISDHSKSAYYANGLNEEQLFEQWKEIDNLNNNYTDFRIFKGIEVDILPDGSLDYDEDILQKFDFVIVSVHSSFNMNKQEMTDRIIKALTNKYTTILGHPTGRLLLAREGYNVDIGKIIEIAAAYGKIIEINSNPYRLDLDWRYIKPAKEKGVMFAICPDVHNIEGLDHVKYGIGIARKGWLEPKNIVNTLNIEDFSKFLKDLRNQ